MTLTLTDIRELMQDLEQSSLREFSLQTTDVSLQLSKNEQAVVSAAPVMNTTGTNVLEEAVAATQPLDRDSKAEGTVVAPLVGTVYLKPSPDAVPFKQVGDRVAVGEQVAIVESMKLMTPVKSTVAGVITAVLVEEEEVVDFDKPLFNVALDD
jgi:acetyl-CoA carboxylase biotin carboxyl carrier protein